MELRLTFREYLEALRSQSNAPVSIDLLVRPFGIPWRRRDDRTVLVGHVLDAMSDYIQPHEFVDCLDVATVAWELGCLDADRFLDEAPAIMFERRNQFVFRTGPN